MGEHSPLGKLEYATQLYSALHVWFAVIRPAKQPALKMPFNEKRPTLLPWCLLGRGGYGGGGESGCI